MFYILFEQNNAGFCFNFSSQFQIKMRFLKVFKNLVHQADFFSTTQLVRYQEDPDFKTFTGGLFSIAIITLLAIIFGRMSLTAVRRQHIDWAAQIHQDSVPPLLSLPFSTFNIGIELQGLNLSSTIQYFDVVMSQKVFKNKIFQSNNQIPLKMCQREDWSITTDILGNFDRMNASNWLCPQVRSSFFVQGKWTSDDFSTVEINVYDCGKIRPQAQCANQSDINLKLTNIMHFSIYYINALVAAGSSQPVSYYLSDKDFIYFGNTLGSSNELFIQDYEITTDHSILPYTDTKVDKGGMITLPTTISTQEVAHGWYSRFVFRKATSKYVYTRSFAKFDTVISYIGGLFGAIMGLLFLMNHYTRTNFEISLGSVIYHDKEGDEDKEENDAPTMNFCFYVGFWVFKLLTMAGYQPNWPTYKKINRYRDQIQKHLDIKLIIDKLNFLERSVYSLCGQDKYKALHLKEKITIEQAKQLRQCHYLRPLVIAHLLKRKREKKELKQHEKEEDNINENIKPQTPMCLLGRGKITPQCFDPPSVKSEQNSQNQNEGERRSDSHSTFKFTKKTRTYIKQRKSFISELQQDLENIEGFQMPDVTNSLDSIWREALNGNELCQKLWNTLDSDVKVILEKRFQKDNPDFVIQKSLASDPPNEASQVQ